MADGLLLVMVNVALAPLPQSELTVNPADALMFWARVGAGCKSSPKQSTINPRRPASETGWR